MHSRCCSFFRVVCLLVAGLWITAATPAHKPSYVITFHGFSDQEKQRSTMVSNMIRELATLQPLSIDHVILSAENELPQAIEKIAEQDVGIILIIDAKNHEQLAKLPALYPDINFAIIGGQSPIYAPNVRTMHFREQEGAFMTGAIAALRTQSGVVGYLAAEDSPATRNLAYAFLQGAKHSNPEVRIVQQLGPPKNTKPGSSPFIGDTQPDIVFVQDDTILDSAIQMAKSGKLRLITNNHDISAQYPGLMLTTLVKHYDLAMYQTVRAYTRDEWKAGSQSLGIGSGYIDYQLGSSNKELLPKEIIEQIETTKDLVGQGLIAVNNLGQ